jgi:hypothetical protein
MNVEKIAESTASRALSRLAIILMVPLIGFIGWMVQHEISILESGNKALETAMTERSKILWDQIGKMNSVQNDTVNKLTMVGTRFDDHTKDDDKFSSNVTDSLKNIAQQLRDITVSSARIAPTSPAASPAAAPAISPQRP